MVFEAVVSRHAIFRTRLFSTGSIQDGHTLQVVLSTKIGWPLAKSLSQYCRDDRATPVRYGTELCRWALVEKPSETRYFVWTAHHAIYDGWTLPRMFREIRQGYAGLLQAPPIPYNTFVHYVLQLESSDDY